MVFKGIRCIFMAVMSDLRKKNKGSDSLPEHPDMPVSVICDQKWQTGGKRDSFCSSYLCFCFAARLIQWHSSTKFFSADRNSLSLQRILRQELLYWRREEEFVFIAHLFLINQSKRLVLLNNNHIDTFGISSWLFPRKKKKLLTSSVELSISKRYF